jgi:hypothetical protein
VLAVRVRRLRRTGIAMDSAIADIGVAPFVFIQAAWLSWD